MLNQFYRSHRLCSPATAESGGEGGATKDEENQAEDAKAKKPKIKHEETEE